MHGKSGLHHGTRRDRRRGNAAADPAALDGDAVRNCRAAAPWPHGWPAVVSTFACAALVAAAIWIPSYLPTRYAHQIVGVAMLAIIVVSRIYRPELISWGAWIIAIGITAVPWMLFPGL